MTQGQQLPLYCQDFYNKKLEEAHLRHADGSRAPCTVDKAIERSQQLLLSMQYPEGCWCAEVESNVTFTSELVLLYKILGVDDQYPMHKIENYIRNKQRSHGGWDIAYGDGGELSTSVEAYMALKLMGVPTSDPAMESALKFIHSKGGVTKVSMFTKLHLALVGGYDWSGLPTVPLWVMLVPSWFPTSIYEMSSWARVIGVPCFVLFDKKPVFQTSPSLSFDELYVEGRGKARLIPDMKGTWKDIFVVVDSALKLADRWGLVPFRQRSLRAIEKFVIERQGESGIWGGIFPSTAYSIICLKLLNYDPADPMIQRGLSGLKDHSMETEDEYWVQSCSSHVWDTAFIVRSLAESGIPRDHPALQRAGDWLLKKQILQHYGDWWIKTRTNATGGWAFESDNRWYPDVDDSAVVVMGLNEIVLQNESVKKAAIARCVDWISSMQCKSGGWGGFDKDSDQDWLNQTPFGDMKATIDPNSADVTAKVVEMSGRLRKTYGTMKAKTPPKQSLRNAVAYLLREQEPEGCWYGRWGVNYIYGTYGAIMALTLIGGEEYAEQLQRAAKWLVDVQNKEEDGGWGEEVWTYNLGENAVKPLPEGRVTVKGRGPSTASQTAWALMGLLAVGEVLGRYEVDAIERGVAYLLSTQRLDGSWYEAWFTGTGFPCHLYMRYHYYALHFPLTALARYRSLNLQSSAVGRN